MVTIKRLIHRGSHYREATAPTYLFTPYTRKAIWTVAHVSIRCAHATTAIFTRIRSTVIYRRLTLFARVAFHANARIRTRFIDTKAWKQGNCVCVCVCVYVLCVRVCPNFLLAPFLPWFWHGCPVRHSSTSISQRTPSKPSRQAQVTLPWSKVQVPLLAHGWLAQWSTVSSQCSPIKWKVGVILKNSLFSFKSTETE